MPRKTRNSPTTAPPTQPAAEPKEREEFNAAIGSEPKATRFEVQKAITCEVFVESFISEMERIMREKNISQAELARRLGCSPSNITQLMRYASNMNALTMANIATALEQRISVRFKPLR